MPQCACEAMGGSSVGAPPVLDGSTTHHASKTVFAVSLHDKDHYALLQALSYFVPAPQQ